MVSFIESAREAKALLLPLEGVDFCVLCLPF